MHKRTKTKLLFGAFMLLSLGWALQEWRPGLLPTIPYYEETARVWRKAPDELQRHFVSARTSKLGAFVENNSGTIAGAYAIIALVMLLLTPGYRDEGWELLGAFGFGLVAFVVWFIIASWIGTAGSEMRLAHGGTFAVQRGDASWLIKLFTGLIHPLLMIVLGLTLWIGVPMYLLVLLFAVPSILYVIVRLLVRLPFLIYHHLHYLTVPHPGETAYREGMANGIPMPELARTVSDAMYRHELKDFDALPKGWKSKNWTKRIDAFHDRLKAEDRFMEELINHLRLKSQFRE